MKNKIVYVVVSLALLLVSCGGGGGGGSTTTSGGSSGGSSPPLIVSFSPTAGAAGTTVQIDGLLFDATPAQNTVRFNGVTATVLSATTTQIIALVPAGASTGPIQVVTSGGSGTSSQSFTVLGSTTPGVAWTTRLIGPRARPTGLAWDGSKFVSVGGSIQTSTGLLIWDERDAMANLSDVAWDGRSFVTVGGWGGIYSSNDGLTWTSRGSPGDADLYSVAGSGTLWVAVGAAGAIRTSPDGITWTMRTSPITKDLRSVAWSGSQFVAVGNDGTIITSPDGITWTARTSGTADSFTAVGATASLMVAATYPYPGSTSAILTSADGITWTSRATGLGTFNKIIYAGGRWVAAGFYTVATSTDGVNWSVSSSGPGNSIGILESVVYTGGEYVAIGTTGYSLGAVYTSPDAATWTLRSSEQALRAMARSATDGKLIAIGTSDVSLVSADDGATWQYGGLNSLTGNLFLDVEWSPALGAFVAIAQEAANEGIYTSTNGTDWTRLAYAPSSSSGALGASPTLLVNVGGTLVGNVISTSPDGVSWTARTNPTTQFLQEVFWTGSQFIAVGNAGSIVTSPDGVTWTLRTSGVTATLYGAAASPAQLVVVGASGTILTSSDGGVTWVPRNSGTTYTLRRVAWTGAEFVAVGSSGMAVRSTDGVTWTVQATPYTSPLFGSDPFNLNDLVWTGTGGRLVVVGTRGLVATSP